MLNINEYLINRTTKETTIKLNEKVLVFEVDPILDYGPMEPTVQYNAFVDKVIKVHDNGDLTLKDMGKYKTLNFRATKIDLDNLEEPLQENEDIIPDYEITVAKNLVNPESHYLIFSNRKANQLIHRESKTDKPRMYWNGAEIYFKGSLRHSKDIVIDYLKEEL